MNEATAMPLDPMSDDQLAELASHLFEKGSTLADLRGLTNDEMEAIYTIAYNFYDQEKTEEAEKIFHFLCIYNHLDKRFWMGLGACRQQLQQYKSAVDAYSYLALLDTESPYPPMHAADCYLALNDLGNAENGFHAALHWAGDNDQYSRVKQRAELMLQVVKQKMESSHE